MHLSNLNYTIGVYSESPEGNLSASGPALLTRTLAWAVQNDIPFHEVILSLTQRGNAGLNRVLFLLPYSKKWEKCLLASYTDLVNGIPLYQTLRKRFAYFLPEYYLQAVEKAEKEGHLEEILPVFAKRLNFSIETKIFYKRALTFPFSELLIICAVLSFFTVFVFPNFTKIFEDLTWQNQTTVIVSKVLYVISEFWEIVRDVVFTMLAWSFLARIFVGLRRLILMLLGELFIFIPPFRGQLRNIAFLDLSSSMASYLDAGEDILTAAKLSKKSCNHFWLRRKLNRFISKMEKGENWLDAWDSMNLRQNLSECIIRNAAAKENIAAGFDTISDWLYHKQIRTIKNNGVWLTIIFTAINSVIVFFIAFFMFQMLTQIIYACA
jgi:type II secretory pathway component PulF